MTIRYGLCYLEETKMARKFQIGDTVQVVKDELPGGSLGLKFKIGHRGVVVEYNSGYKPHCYNVRRKKNKYDLWFTARELKLIKRKGD